MSLSHHHEDDAYDASDDGEATVPEGLEQELLEAQLRELAEAGWPEGVRI